MASRRNSSDPADRRRTERDGSSLEVASEDQVAQQTEEVFQSYVFYRYRQEQEQTGRDVPIDPEIAVIEPEPDSINNQVGRRLANIGDDINARYDSEFSEMLKSLKPSRDNAYEYFVKIASSQAALLSPLCHLEVVSVLQPGKLTYSAFSSLSFSDDVCVNSLHFILWLLNFLQWHTNLQGCAT
ncbi:bcl-2 homologous antagonist/killer isoform X2 [Zootoca vivipara]|uniref:bcl-2 homologous antagonist/killer isoform X2 n=1 Tax=Zootoca vivipara TaxID=8524 RepID=UPI00293BF435|nr:bcl-2 homologous antagonist/killer isoform X2 [Zootoca vivipara]